MSVEYVEELMRLAIEFQDRMVESTCTVCGRRHRAINKDDKWYCSWECFDKGEK